MAPGCALKLGNQPNDTAIGRLEAGRSQVRENYLAPTNLSQWSNRPVCVMWALPEGAIIGVARTVRHRSLTQAAGVRRAFSV